MATALGIRCFILFLPGGPAQSRAEKLPRAAALRVRMARSPGEASPQSTLCLLRESLPNKLQTSSPHGRHAQFDDDASLTV